jgi:hypothetical protein
MIEPRDDLAHEIGPGPTWREEYVFAFTDEASWLGGLVRADVRAADRSASAAVHLFLPGGTAAVVVARGDRGAGGGVTAGGILCEPEQPLERWRLRCKDTALIFSEPSAAQGVERSGGVKPVDLDVDVEATMPPVGEAARELHVDPATRLARATSHGRLEQALRVRGSVRVGDRDWPVDARGVRRKFWGPASASGARWYAVSFADDFAMALHQGSSSSWDTRAGWVWREGRAVEVGRVSEVERSASADHLRATDADGHVYEVKAFLERVMPLGPNQGSIALARFVLEERTALGVIDAEGTGRSAEPEGDHHAVASRNDGR